MSKENKDVVIRISRENHKRLKELMKSTVDSDGKEPTTNQLMEKLLDSMDNVRNGRMVYIVDNIVFEDVALARGEAIVRAVKMQDIPQWPEIAIVVGEDHGS